MTPAGYTAEIKRWASGGTKYIIFCNQMNDELPFIRPVRRTLEQLILDVNAEIPLLKTKVVPKLLEKKARDLSGSSDGRFRVYSQFSRNYIEALDQSAINELWNIDKADIPNLNNLDQLSVQTLSALQGGVFTENQIAQADWKGFEKTNGVFKKGELIGTIRSEDKIFTTFIRCDFQKLTAVVRFVYINDRLAYIAQNDNYGPRWNLYRVSGSQDWLVFDIPSDRSAMITLQKNDIRLRNPITP